MVNYLVRNKINRVLSISIVLMFTLLVSGVIIALLCSQASRFSEAWPQLIDKFQGLLNETVSWSSGYFNISVRKINVWITHTKGEIINGGMLSIGSTLASMGYILAAAALTIVYICMILFYQELLLEFTHKLFGIVNDDKVSEILIETKTIIKSYLVGLFAEFAIIAFLNAAGLLLLGIDYAILLGIIGALLNVIPIIGGIVGVVLFMAIALVTKAPVFVFYIVILHMLIQFIDNHYIIPKIVGSKVKLNALVCLIVVIAGAALWGIPGMFLSIPLTAILKLVLDRIDSLKPWGFLLGDTVTPAEKMKFSFAIKGFIRNITSNKI